MRSAASLDRRHRRAQRGAAKAQASADYLRTIPLRDEIAQLIEDFLKHAKTCEYHDSSSVHYFGEGWFLDEYEHPTIYGVGGMRITLRKSGRIAVERDCSNTRVGKPGVYNTKKLPTEYLETVKTALKQMLRY